MTACGSTSIFTIRPLTVRLILSQSTRRTALCSFLFCRAKKPIPSLMRSGKSLSGMGSSRAQPERRDESGRASKNTLSDACKGRKSLEGEPVKVIRDESPGDEVSGTLIAKRLGVLPDFLHCGQVGNHGWSFVVKSS